MNTISRSCGVAAVIINTLSSLPSSAEALLVCVTASRRCACFVHWFLQPPPTPFHYHNIDKYDKDLSPCFLFLLFLLPSTYQRFNRTSCCRRRRVCVCVSTVSVLCPAGVGGRLAFVAVQESGHDDQNGPQEEHAVGSSRQHVRLCA